MPIAKTPTPHPALTQAHQISGKAAKASAVTAVYVEKIIRKAVGAKPTEPEPTAPEGPAVNTSYSVYKSKPKLPARSKETSPTPSPMFEGTGTPPPPATMSGGIYPSFPDPQPRKPLRTRDRVLMSANLVLTTLDDSARRVFDVGSDRLGAVIGHKCVLSSRPYFLESG